MRLVVPLLALCALAPIVGAQPMWRAAPDGAAVSLDALTTTDDVTYSDGGVDDVRESRLITSAMLLSARVPVGRVTVRAELPLAVLLFSGDLVNSEDGGTNEVAIGNPMIGAEVRLAAPRGLDALTVGAEFRLPLANGTEFGSFGDASFVGSFADRQRFEAYEGRTTSLLLRTSATLAPSPTSRATVSLAPVITYTGNPDALEGGGSEGDLRDVPSTNLGVLGSAIGSVQLGRMSVGGGLIGRYEPKGGSLSYGENRLFADGTLHAALEGLAVRPGVQLVLPITPRFDGTPGSVLGLSLDVPLR